MRPAIWVAARSSTTVNVPPVAAAASANPWRASAFSGSASTSAPSP